MLKISPLFSGSHGNCTLIQSDKTNILLDLGYSYRAIVSALSLRGLTPADISAIVITHEHNDHVYALPMWTRRTATPVFSPCVIADTVQLKCYSQVYDIVGDFDIEDIHIDIYECSHDSQVCYGYRFSKDGKFCACVTDTGCTTDALVEFLAPCSVVMLESNHDVELLMNGEYSYPLKQRILSKKGHLSNAQAAEVITKLVDGNVRQVILAHLSEQNNTRELAFNSAVRTCAACGLVEGKDVKIYVADQYKNGITLWVD